MKRVVFAAAILLAGCTQVETVDGETIDMAKEMNSVAREMQEGAPKARSDEEILDDLYHEQNSDEGWGTNDSSYSDGWGGDDGSSRDGWGD